ncbi:hypothetical protein QUF64_07005 [Anaerolineales bacterium HSG6]|nr:hypothetical protein [Anaerolineales bacterium HSG6]
MEKKTPSQNTVPPNQNDDTNNDENKTPSMFSRIPPMVRVFAPMFIIVVCGIVVSNFIPSYSPEIPDTPSPVSSETLVSEQVSTPTHTPIISTTSLVATKTRTSIPTSEDLTDTPTPTPKVPTNTPIPTPTNIPIPSQILSLNQTPEGELLPGQEVTINADVTPDGLSHFWGLESTNPEQTVQPTQGQPIYSFTPQKPGLYTVTLMVKDEDSREVHDAISITVSEPLSITKLSTPENELIVGTPVTISAETNKANTQFRWKEPLKIAVGAGALITDAASTITDVSDRETSSFSFTPLVSGTYQAQVIATYGEQTVQTTTMLTVWDKFQITDLVAERTEINVGEETTITVYTNRPTDEVMFEWEVNGITDDQNSGSGKDNYSFIGSEAKDYNIGVEASYDEQKDKKVTLIAVTAVARPQPPQILSVDVITLDNEVGIQQTVYETRRVTANVNKQDVTYNWTVQNPNGVDVNIVGDETSSITFTPDMPGSYTINLTVSDGQQSDSWSDSVEVDSPPIELLPAVDIEDCDGDLLDLNCASSGKGDYWRLRWKPFNPPVSLPDGWYYTVRFLKTDINTPFLVKPLMPNQLENRPEHGDWLVYSFYLYDLPNDEVNGCYPYWDIIVVIDADLVNCSDGRSYNGVCRLTRFPLNQRSLGTQYPGACPTGGGGGDGSRGNTEVDP